MEPAPIRRRRHRENDEDELKHPDTRQRLEDYLSNMGTPGQKRGYSEITPVREGENGVSRRPVLRRRLNLEPWLSDDVKEALRPPAPQNQVAPFGSDPGDPRSFIMNSKKRSRQLFAPVSTTSSVNFNTVNRVITLSGREYISDVVSSGTASAFSTFSKLLRPTDGDLFSWLAPIARKFEEFKFSSLRFVYEPQIPSTTAGQVGLYFDGDPTHLPPANWNNFINTGANAHGAVWAKHMLTVPAWLYSSRLSYYTTAEFPDAATGIATAPRPTDPLEYFPGLFGWCTEGLGANTLCGKVYLEYTLSLKTQNVDGYNITASTGALISTEAAVNSGAGWMYKLSNFPAGAPSFPFGNYSAATPPTVAVDAGTRYFQPVTIAGSVYQKVLQNCNLLVVVRATSAAALTVKPQVAPMPSTAIAPTFGDMTAANMLVIKDNEPAAQDRCMAFQVQLVSGQLFAIHADQILTYFHLLCAPWAFAIQQ